MNKVHIDQLRLHFEALIDPHLEQMGTPTPEARARMLEFINPQIEGFAKSADADGYLTAESLVVLASIHEFSQKALHNAVFAVFSLAQDN
jgi:hypothetical protein